jgi:hypothetical protein
MPLTPGETLGGRYQLLSKLGEGGMGEVWKARDAELGREVALKVSKAEFTARFKQEARTIAAFNHPNICHVYDVGPNFLVMELIDGAPLTGPLPVGKAVAYAGFILDALDAAHRKGFAHRDLKPANVMVTRSGVLKLLDFGLAKRQPTAVGPDDDTVTQEGHISGTLQYMSPEQLQGKDADARSDIFSFGCVLYEMLSGKRAFGGASPASVIAAILERDPEPLRTTPPLDRVIRKCLAKDPDERFQTARDLKYNLSLALETPASTPSRRAQLPWAIATGLMTLIAAALAALYFTEKPELAPETRVDIVTPPTNSPASFALSPDGRKIAYVATTEGVSRLWVRPLDSISAQPLPGTENALNPFWSPDSRSLGFFADLKLKRIELGAEQPQTLTGVGNVIAQGTWGADGTILFNSTGSGGPLMQIPATGGRRAIAVTKLADGAIAHRFPRFLPGGKFLFTSFGPAPGIWAGSLTNQGATTEPHRVAELGSGESQGEYLAPGWLVRVRGTALVAQRFDASSGQVSGEPVTVAQAAGFDSFSGAGAFSVAAGASSMESGEGGKIAWRSGGGHGRQLIWFNRSGQNVGGLGDPDDAGLAFPEISPAGNRIVFTRGPAGGRALWLKEGVRTTRLTFEPADHVAPIWAPDGKRVVFRSSRSDAPGLYQKPADGSGSEELLLKGSGYPNSWSPDGRFILFNDGGLGKNALMVLPMTGGDRKPYPFLRTPFNERQGAFSPDGKWVAYTSNESGRNEVYVRPFPGPGGQWQISTGGGAMPRWRPDGEELYYVSPDDRLMAVAASAPAGTFVPGTPEALFQTHIAPVSTRQNYDVARDGRFLIVTQLDDASTEPIHLLLNWHPPGK